MPAKLGRKTPGSGLGWLWVSWPHLSATPKKVTGRKSGDEESLRLPGDSDEDAEDGFEPSPPFEYQSRKTLRSSPPEQTHFQNPSTEGDEPLAHLNPTL